MPRRLMAKFEIRKIEELFLENANEASLQDERWKVAFFKALSFE